MAALVGKWAYSSAENLDAYMEATGVPENLRELARESKPEMEVKKDGDTWTITTIMADKEKVSTFTIDQEFDATSLLGHPLKCKAVMDGEKMTETQKVGDIEILIGREVVGDELVSTMTVKGVTATVKFKKA